MCCGEDKNKCCCCCRMTCGVKCIGILDILYCFTLVADFLILKTILARSQILVIQFLFFQPIMLLFLVHLPRSVSFIVMCCKKKDAKRRKAAYIVRLVGSVFFLLLNLMMVGISVIFVATIYKDSDYDEYFYNNKVADISFSKLPI